MSDKAEESTSAEAQITFKVKASGDKNHQITMAEAATVSELKTKLATEQYENIPVERQRLIYSGRVMKNEDTLASYKVKPGNTIHLVKSAASNPAPAPSASSSSPVPQAVPSNMAAGTSANNLLAGLTGARFAGHANLPSANMFGADGGMGAPPSEDQMADMLSNPNVAQAMNEALNNPQLVDVMIQTNPMLRDNPNAREIIQSPFFRNMLTNPDMLRTVAQMRRSMGGGAGGEAFPAPGATDTTPADAAAAGAGGASNAQPPQFPFMIPGMFGGGPGAGAAGGVGGPGGQGANPFAALFNPFGAAAATAPQTGAGTDGTDGAAGAAGTTGTSSGDNAAQRNASAAAGSAPPGQSGSNSASQPTNPFAGLFGAPQGGAENPFGMTPEMMQNFAQMMRGAPQGGATNPFGMTPEMMQNFMQNLMGGAAEPAAPADSRPPEERYAEQLSQLNEMGFYDFDQNVAALRRSGGNVQGAVNFLLGG
ncbi:putative deubiquitination-protection protein dph1 [Diaporthe ampelina]|uniref:Putative deubiquitination-protection protein dph1 n=1 Tax=Diaporthe ampelina TaxID=1214573 RepID=A0A0G2HWN0_9PEZI|nr:putative deubiquitination-protection protein dph1 [Diaporthe ampelina]